MKKNNLITSIIVLILFPFTLFSEPTVNFIQINEPIDIRINESIKKNEFVKNFLVNEENIYTSSETTSYDDRLLLPDDPYLDSLNFYSNVIVKYNKVNNDIDFIKQINDTTGSVFSQLMVLNDDGGFSLYTGFAKVFSDVLFGIIFFNTKHFDIDGNLIYSYTDTAAPKRFYRNYKIVRNPEGKLIVIAQPEIYEMTPYLALRFDKDGKFLDSNVAIPKIYSADSVFSPQIDPYVISPTGEIYVHTSYQIRVNKKLINKMEHSLICLDKDEQKIKWEMKFNEGEDFNKRANGVFSEPAFYRNGDIAILVWDIDGEASDGNKYRLYLMRIDKEGNVLSKKFIKRVSNPVYIPKGVKLLLNEYDEAIIVGSMGSSSTDEWIRSEEEILEGGGRRSKKFGFSCQF